MDEARSLLDALDMGGGIPNSTHVIWAREQVAGRGRRGRSWSSPPGNLYATVATVLPVPLSKAPQCSFVSCLALRDALQEAAPHISEKLCLKWPNDVLLSGAKIAGLLLETVVPRSRFSGEKKPWILIGSGVNIATMPNATPYPVTCVQEHAPSISLETVLTLYLKKLATRLDQWRMLGFERIRADWLEKAYRLGEPIQVRDPAKPEEHIECLFQTISADGALVVLQDGEKRQFDAAEILFSDPMDGVKSAEREE